MRDQFVKPTVRQTGSAPPAPTIMSIPLLCALFECFLRECRSYSTAERLKSCKSSISEHRVPSRTFTCTLATRPCTSRTIIPGVYGPKPFFHPPTQSSLCLNMYKLINSLISCLALGFIGSLSAVPALTASLQPAIDKIDPPSTHHTFNVNLPIGKSPLSPRTLNALSTSTHRH